MTSSDPHSRLLNNSKTNLVFKCHFSTRIAPTPTPDFLAQLYVLVTGGKLDRKCVHDCESPGRGLPSSPSDSRYCASAATFSTSVPFPSSFSSVQTNLGIPPQISPSFAGGATRQVARTLGSLPGDRGAGRWGTSKGSASEVTGAVREAGLRSNLRTRVTFQNPNSGAAGPPA